ncbi:hypothetical protein GCM10011609_57720 [Lentzea pudingi]|uniref:PA domain-containing protein n=1 Tax=Lentzea pudingi TaxID=1789439 RepID=A0ABQ2IHT2_9PSEU|nr:PA domain-containing protein [Lentzea pudingi]GGN10420.1 hypothetical protein GCM10011609_57720 [Lentzea pudingi]
MNYVVSHPPAGRRGAATACGFTVEVLNAQATGAAAVVLFDEGQPGRTGPSTPIGDTPGAFDTSAVNGVRAPGKSHGRAPRGSAS